MDWVYWERATQSNGEVCAGPGRTGVLPGAELFLVDVPGKALSDADITLSTDGLCTLWFG